jgi:hypothetical protein
MGTLRISRSTGCWLDVFDAQNFTGQSCRLRGPAEFLGLRLREDGWGEALASLRVGPGAYVQCFRADDFYDTVMWLLPNQTVERVEDLDAADGIDSIRLYDRPPFAHEPGYSAYMLWAASQIAKMGGA